MAIGGGFVDEMDLEDVVDSAFDDGGGEMNDG